MKVHHFQALVIGALCLGAAVLAAESYNQHQQLSELQTAARNAPADPGPSLRRDIGELRTTLATLSPQVAAQEDAQHQHTTAQATLGQQLDELAASVRVLQALPPGPSSADLTALAQRMGAAEVILEKLSTAPTVPAAAVPPTPPISGQSKAKAPQPPFTLQGIETRGTIRFVAVLPAGAHALSTVHLLQPGDSLNGWQLRAIRKGQAVFHVPGHGDRTLPIP
ncbi:TPA: hypothetical protein QEM85_000257 [Pseudomonas putida]|uniref:hypothetical protein n=1 Tax=Pseudomonas putida TaxID=303 RepID=UPI00110CB71F|nr:hypothetical protein [Pseudomonas putida]MDD1992783.1 hypothetical protein [Pseudomonas putida]HDS0918376.1 hypothetical protein [Pseudomonas putida]HDS0931657.1 hypothetical protein [Pseudomonas putida]HDS1782285.1 hypothetical protein [Pseudomonas putida]HDS3796934.1 hypothetical protein [Pseudomonas putida]